LRKEKGIEGITEVYFKVIFIMSVLEKITSKDAIALEEKYGAQIIIRCPSS